MSKAGDISRSSWFWFGFMVTMNAASMATTHQWYWRLINFVLCTLFVWERARRFEALVQRRDYKKIMYPIAQQQLDKAMAEHVAAAYAAKAKRHE